MAAAGRPAAAIHSFTGKFKLGSVYGGLIIRMRNFSGESLIYGACISCSALFAYSVLYLFHRDFVNA